MSTKPTTKKPARKTAKKRVWRGPNAMGKSETVPLAIAAREAYDYQDSLGLIDGEKFVDWRHAQVLALTGRSGLTDCDHDHFQPLLAHFQTLAGKDAEAFEALIKSGKVHDNGLAEDTHEKRVQLAHTIMEILNDHIHFADTPWPILLKEWSQESRDAWYREHTEETELWPGLDTKKVVNLSLRKAHIEENGGAIRVGYLIGIVRHKTHRPDLNLGRDIEVGLAERCTVSQLTQIRDTMVNRINARQGAGATKRRNRKQKSAGAKAEKKARIETPRW